ncbi:MAG: SMC-Scp complex subunit ScpB [Pseudomonadota bacterium]|jgi:segregation and condensation protein B
MTTVDENDPTGGPGPFSEEELASVAAPPSDAELEDTDAATIEVDDAEPDLASAFEKLVTRSRKLTDEQARNVVQSVLFVAAEPQSVDQLFEATGIDRDRLRGALEKLQGKLREGVSGIVLHEVGGGWQLRTAPESAEYVRRFLRVKPQRLTRAAVETLAIIAYRQPVTRPEVEDIRGVDCGAVVKALLDRKLIKILGKKEDVGRPILYGTTKEFLEYFALKDLTALPTLREFQELSEEHQEIVEKETGSTEKPVPQGTLAELADPEFGKRLEAQAAESEAALQVLEEAMEEVDASSKAAASILAPPAPPPAEAPAAPAEGPESTGLASPPESP